MHLSLTCQLVRLCDGTKGQYGAPGVVAAILRLASAAASAFTTHLPLWVFWRRTNRPVLARSGADARLVRSSSVRCFFTYFAGVLFSCEAYTYFI